MHSVQAPCRGANRRRDPPATHCRATAVFDGTQTCYQPTRTVTGTCSPAIEVNMPIDTWANAHKPRDNNYVNPQPGGGDGMWQGWWVDADDLLLASHDCLLVAPDVNHRRDDFEPAQVASSCKLSRSEFKLALVGHITGGRDDTREPRPVSSGLAWLPAKIASSRISHTAWRLAETRLVHVLSVRDIAWTVILQHSRFLSASLPLTLAAEISTRCAFLSAHSRVTITAACQVLGPRRWSSTPIARADSEPVTT